MNFIDVIIIVLVVVFCIKGFLRGFLRELFSVLIFVLGLVGAFLFYRALNTVMSVLIENEDLSLILSFAAIFVGITILLVLVRNTLIRFTDKLNFSDVDHVLGVVIGLFKGVLVCGAVFIFLYNHPVLKLDRAIDRSTLFPLLERMFMALFSLLPDGAAATAYLILGIV
ncbi:MAG: CvpA family protein [Spirochaetes bacterium]|nr:CvpA family protein [Spirochaetota bacterium]